MEKYLENASQLSKFNLFDNLSPGELKQIAKNVGVHHFPANEVVCVEDTASDSMYFIRKGKVRISAKEVAFAHLKAGDYFGEMSLIADRPRNATVTTLVPSVLFEISTDVFSELLEKSPTVSYNLLLTYDARLRRHNDLVVGQYQRLRQQYKELENSHKRLLSSDKMASIGLLTSGIAHEINNPLFVITGYLNVLNEGLREGGISEEELQEIANKLNTAAESITNLVAGIKTYARLEQAPSAPIDLNSTIRDSLNLVAFLYKKENIELQKRLSAGSPMILGNIGTLQQVLMNLFSNAKDAMETSNKKRISVDTYEMGKKVALEVSDSGCGIEPENLERLFSRAFSTKPVGKGSGMGLDLVRKIVEDMGGSIEVASVVSKGTTFRLVFPRHGD